MFIDKAKKVHGNKYGYAKTKYVSARIKVTIYCRTCRTYFEQNPNSHLSGRGCPTCGIAKSRRTGKKNQLDRTEIKSRTEEFIKQAKEIHGERYNYKDSSVTLLGGKVTITCCTCKRVFHQYVKDHLIGKGCLKCSAKLRGEARLDTHDTFVKKARQAHGDKYDYGESVYVKSKEKLLVFCKECDRHFSVTPNNHVKGYGCPCCSKSRRYSKLAIEWLEYESKLRRIKIRHAENGGEFLIPGTSYKADGFNARSKTVFEFYGDCFHGNLNRFKPMDRPNQYSSKTTKQLYAETVNRERIIESLGYTIVSIWEQDWKKFKRTLQAKKFS